MVIALFCLSFSVGNLFVWVFISCGSRLRDLFGGFGISRGVLGAFCISLRFTMLLAWAAGVGRGIFGLFPRILNLKLFGN